MRSSVSATSAAVTGPAACARANKAFEHSRTAGALEIRERLIELGQRGVGRHRRGRLRDDQTQLHRHLGVGEHRLQELAQTAHRLVGGNAAGERNGSVGGQLDLMQLGDAHRGALLFEQPLGDGAHDRDPLVPLQVEAPRENVRQWQ